jgi:hypothetical protein
MSMLELKKYADLNVVESSKSVSNKDHKKVFQIARPILVFLSNFFLIPKNIRLILSHLVEIMDAIVPISNEDASSIVQLR